MSLEITKRPILDEGDPLIFRWNSVENPVNYELQREDVLFNTINESVSAPTKIVCFAGSMTTTEMTVGDTVFFSFGAGTVYPDQLTTILFVDSATSVTLDIPFSIDQNGADAGRINLNETRTNYRVDVFFFNPEDDTKYFTEGTEYQPQDSGFLRIDTSGIMRSFLEAEYVDLQNQENLSLRFYIQIIERFSGTTGTDFTDIANPVGIVLASKQLLDVNGSILKAQTPIVTQDGTGFIINNQAEFLTRFAEPSIWVGFPNFLFAIANGDNTLSGATAFISEQPKDINRTDIGGQTAQTIVGIQDEINRISLTLDKLNPNEEFREVFAGLGVSLKAVIDAANLLPSGGAATTMREAGTIIETDTLYTRSPALTGPDSLLELASFV